MTAVLYCVQFDAPIALPGRKSVSELMPAEPGWAGWKVSIVGDRVEIRSPANVPLPMAAGLEAEAMGWAPASWAATVSIPLARCTLRFIHPDARDFGVHVGETGAPSDALIARRAAPPPPPAPVAATTAPEAGPPPPPAPDIPPTPMRRRPPGVRAPVPPPPSEIVMPEGES